MVKSLSPFEEIRSKSPTPFKESRRFKMNQAISARHLDDEVSFEERLQSGAMFLIKEEEQGYPNGFVSLTKCAEKFKVPKTSLFNRKDAIQNCIQPKQFKLEPKKMKLLKDFIANKFQEGNREPVKRTIIIAEAVKISGQEFHQQPGIETISCLILSYKP